MFLNIESSDRHRKPGLSRPAAAAAVLLIAAGGFFQPLLGLAVPLLILTAGITSRIRKRMFCTRVCPRSRLFPLLKPVSAGRPVPAFFHNRHFRQILCGFMMFCSISQLIRLVPSREGFAALGTFFWGLCILTLAVSALLGLLFKPAAWCTLCPMGTLQDTLSPSGRK